MEIGMTKAVHIIVIGLLLFSFLSAQDIPEIWGLDNSTIEKYNFARKNLFEICTKNTDEWRKGSYPELPKHIKRLPVPGGGYTGFWYWDSCFVPQQYMQINSQFSVAYDTFNMFCWEIDQFGRIDNEIMMKEDEPDHPRSQMPLFTWFSNELYKKNNDLEFLMKAYTYASKEMKGFWLNTEKRHPRFDVTTGLNHNDTDIDENRNQQSAWEHGWDNNARMDTETDNWYRVLPVDLNAVLYFNEITIGSWAKRLKSAGYKIKDSDITFWNNRASNRKKQIQKYFYDEKTNYYYDFDLDQNARTKYVSLAPSWLIWAGAIEQKYADEISETLLTKFIQPYNLPPCVLSDNYPKYGKQAGWSMPWSWSPVVHLMTSGLNKNDHLTYIKETLVNKWIRFHGGRAEKYTHEGKAGGVPILGWGMSVYFSMVQNYKLGFHSDLTQNLITLSPITIKNKAGGRFNVHGRKDVSVTYTREANSIGAIVKSDDSYNLKTTLYFDMNTDVSSANVFINNDELEKDQYELVNLDLDSEPEGIRLSSKLKANKTFIISIKK
jgi:hypothetical protein